jgi:hypothetical protein
MPLLDRQGDWLIQALEGVRFVWPYNLHQYVTILIERYPTRLHKLIEPNLVKPNQLRDPERADT